MARYGVETKMNREQVMQAAMKFFGAGGVGLDVVEQEECCARFEGGGGHVYISIDVADDQAVSLSIETREWDYQVRQFMAQIA